MNILFNAIASCLIALKTLKSQRLLGLCLLKPHHNLSGFPIEVWSVGQGGQPPKNSSGGEGETKPFPPVADFHSHILSILVKTCPAGTEILKISLRIDSFCCSKFYIKSE